MSSIEFSNFTKKFGKNTVIKDLNLKIEEGKFTVLVGPSGCGKTTLLRTIAGLESPSSGQILINEKSMANVSPAKRDVAMVFQNYALYPTMNVKENIEFGLKNNKVKKQKRTELIKSISSTVGLSEYLERKPSDLSGGQRQRVALARAMVKQPSVFLMDEPLSNLDAKLRVQMRLELIEIHKKLGTTFVYVTHDQVEAMAMADQIVLMNKGAIQQVGSPEEIYKNPKNTFTAQFIGMPSMNVYELGLDGVKYGFRPEKVSLSHHLSPTSGLLIQGMIHTREMLGSETVYQVKGNQLSYMVKTTDDSFSVDDSVYLFVNYEDIYFFDEHNNRMTPDHEQYPIYLKYLTEERSYQYV